MLSRYKHTLISLFRQIHELQAAPLERRSLAFEIQEILLRRITSTESLIRKTRAENKSIKVQLSQRTADRNASRRAKSRLEAGEEKLERYKELISTFRSIGDAIAFIYGDRWDLKQLALKQDSGFISGKRGTRLERAIFRGAFKMGATVVLNDLTHVLRHGDITLFRPDLWPDGGSPFLLIEAKSGRGGNRARAERQMAAVKKISDYLSSDVRTEEGGVWQRISCKTAPQHHFETATRLMREVSSVGWLTEEVEKGLFYILIEVGGPQKNYDEILGPLLSSGQISFMLSVNAMKGERLGFYPFPLCIRDPEQLFRFYNGEFVMYVAVDLQSVSRSLAPHGLAVENTGDDGHPWRIFSTTGDSNWAGGEAFVGNHPIGRLAAEFLRLDWLTENILTFSPSETIMQKLSELGFESS